MKKSKKDQKTACACAREGDVSDAVGKVRCPCGHGVAVFFGMPPFVCSCGLRYELTVGLDPFVAAVRYGEMLQGIKTLAETVAALERSVESSER